MPVQPAESGAPQRVTVPIDKRVVLRICHQTFPSGARVGRLVGPVGDW